jgi:hypothetical protein
MRHKNWLRKLGLVILAATLLLGPGDRSWSADDFYVIGGGSPWKRNANNIYYDKGNVGIGTTDPNYLLQIFTTNNPVPMRVQTDASGSNVNAIQASASYGVAVSGYTVTGKGVLGNAQGGAIGVQGECTGYGAGVYGYNSADGPGVRGVSAASNGVFGETSSINELDAGVYGLSHSYSTPGVHGINSGQSYAVGVLGTVVGPYSRGVFGFSPEGTGVSGESNSGYGVLGKSSIAEGVRGESSISYGVLGSSASGRGVSGYSNTGIGVHGYSAYSYAVYAEGNFAVAPGFVKNAIVATSQGDKKLYCQESPEVWFEDFGEGQLVDGLARIDLDPIFLETVTIDEKNPLKVFIQLNDDCNGVYVKRLISGFQVRELRAGNSGARFTYRVVAKRKGFETARLEAAGDIPKFAARNAAQK